MCTDADGNDVKYYKGEDTLVDCELKCAWRSNLCVNLVLVLYNHTVLLSTYVKHGALTLHDGS